jgi:Tfp pilus assembly protein PilP
MNRFVMMAVLFFYCSFLVACSQTSNDEVSVNMDELKKRAKITIGKSCKTKARPFVQTEWAERH